MEPIVICDIYHPVSPVASLITISTGKIVRGDWIFCQQRARGENPRGKESRDKCQRRNMDEGREMHLHAEDTELYPTAPTSAGVCVRPLMPAQGSVSGKTGILISKQVRNKMGKVTKQILQTRTRGGDSSMWLAVVASTVSVARASFTGSTCSWSESRWCTEAAGTTCIAGMRSH